MKPLLESSIIRLSNFFPTFPIQSAKLSKLCKIACDPQRMKYLLSGPLLGGKKDHILK